MRMFQNDFPKCFQQSSNQRNPRGIWLPVAINFQERVKVTKEVRTKLKTITSSMNVTTIVS